MQRNLSLESLSQAPDLLSKPIKVEASTDSTKWGIEANKVYDAYEFEFADGVEGFTIFLGDRMFHRKFKNCPLLGLKDWRVV